MRLSSIAQDRDRKGRNGTLGENSPLAKLTREKVLDIDSLLASTNWGVIARRFGISEITVERIAKRQTWKHLFNKSLTQPDLIAA